MECFPYRGGPQGRVPSARNARHEAAGAVVERVNTMEWRNRVYGPVVLLLLSGCVWGAADPNDKDRYVSRQEYEALKKQLADVETRLKAQEKAAGPQGQVPGAEAPQPGTTEPRRKVDRLGLFDTNLLLTGDAAVGFSKTQDQPSTFTAEFNPMLLWQLNERLFFEGSLELGLQGPETNGEGSATDVELDLANLTYLLNDYILAGAGKFSVPFTAYHNHLDPTWINKLPADPLVYGDGGIAPDSGVGAFATGAAPWRRMLVNYAVFVTNGPALITDDPQAAGSLNFDNYNDLNDNKAVGFRIGLLPFSRLEVGYSFEFSNPNPPGFETVHSTLHGVDLNYVAPIAALQGQLTARAAWVWSNLSEATYDPTGALGFGPLRFANDRNGGYAELAYRPTEAAERFLRNFEFVARYDRLNIPAQAPGGGTQEQWTAGIDYWITARTILKAAYTFGVHENDPEVFALQFATGF